MTLELVPVDFLCESIVEIARQGGRDGQYFHFSQPHPLRWPHLLDRLSVRGYRIEQVARDAWLDALAATGPTNPLYALRGIYVQRIPGEDRSYGDLFVGEPIPISWSNTETAIERYRDRCPPMNDERIDKYLGWMLETGLIQAP